MDRGEGYSKHRIVIFIVLVFTLVWATHSKIQLLT